MKDRLTVKFSSVDRHILPIECDSVRVPVSDSAKGAFSGFYGIKKGHANAVIALKTGDVVVTDDGKTIFIAEISDGFAIVENNLVSINVDRIEEKA